VSALGRLPFPVALALLAAGTAAGVVVSVKTGTILWLIVAIAGVAAFGVLYLSEYARLPGPENQPAQPKPTPQERGIFADETPAPAVAVPAARPAPEPPTGPVEVDTFDPDYDPVAEADAIEAQTATPPPAPDA
jgi:hypothetical protein